MIKLLALKGCDRCEKAKLSLQISKLNFITTYCEDNEALCDAVEDIVDSNIYPILLEVNENSNIEAIYYTVENYNIIGKVIEKKGIKTIGFYSIDKLLEFVSNN